MNHSILSLTATLALVGGSHAAVLVDNFESYTGVGTDMQGKGGWTVSNGIPLDPLEGPVVILDSYTWDASLQSATVGGVESTAGGLSALSHTISVPLVSLTTPLTSFSFETSYTESTSGFRNDFQFVVTASSGNLLTINLTPGAPGEYDVSYSSGFFGGGAMGTLLAGDTTQFQLNTFASGLNVGYSFTNVANPVASGILTGALPTDVINNFSVNWYGFSNGGFGNNSITIDNVSVIPEPSSALLVLLGTSCAFARRRRN